MLQLQFSALNSITQYNPLDVFEPALCIILYHGAQEYHGLGEIEKGLREGVN